jgi:hypothetical protein
MSGRLFLSFWDLCLDNLPQGRFERRVITAADAGAMIRAARAGNALLCVSKDDLLAPYRAKERRRHEELCSELRSKYHWSLGFEDFLSAFDGDSAGVVSIMPLQVAELNPGDSLLIVTCDYRIADNTGSISDPEDRFVLAEDSVAFNLITALLPRETATSKRTAPADRPRMPVQTQSSSLHEFTKE